MQNGWCRLVGVFFILVAKRKLKSIVPIGFLGLHLGNHARTGFNDSAGGLLASGVEDTCHPDFFPNNTFHYFCSLCLQDYWDILRQLNIVKLLPKIQSPFPTDLFP